MTIYKSEKWWFGCNDFEKMHVFLTEKIAMSWKIGCPPPPLENRKSSERKWRLIACAQVRQAWNSLDEARREVVDSAELVADGLLSLEVARNRHPHRFVRELASLRADYDPLGAAAWCLATNASNRIVVRRLGMFVPKPVLCGVVRNVVGNPFCDWNYSHVLMHLSPAVVGLAETIYHDRLYDLMPILGDALEEAGCTNQHFLWHCRGKQPGSRQGCEWEPLTAPYCHGDWLIDILLGKS